MKLEDELQRVLDLSPETGITLDAVEQRRARRHRSRQVATVVLAIVVGLGGMSFLVSSFVSGNDRSTPAVLAPDLSNAQVDIDRAADTPTATLSHGDEVRQGVPVQVIGQGQLVTGFSEPARLISNYLGSSDFSIDLGALNAIAPESITLAADARIESGSEDLLLLAFSKSVTGTDLMTPLLVPTDLRTLDPGHFQMLVVARGDSEVPLQFAFAVDVTGPDEPAAVGTYVFSDVVAGPSKAEPEDLALTFTVDWTTDEYPGVHVCRFIALAEDGSIVGEFTEYSDWEPGRYYRDVPGDARAAATGEVHCQTERLDTPGITDVTPIPHDAGTSIDQIEGARRERLSDWAVQFGVDDMSDVAVAANVRAVWSAVSDVEETTEVWQLTDRMNYLCKRVPSDRELLRDFCG